MFIAAIYSRGETPVCFLKARLKERRLPKPHSYAVFEIEVFKRNISFAFSTRNAERKSEKFMEVIVLKICEK